MNKIQKTKQELGNFLTAIRKEKKISTYEIQKDFGIPINTFSPIEKGVSNYTIESLLKYMNAIGFDIISAIKPNYYTIDELSIPKEDLIKIIEIGEEKAIDYFIGMKKGSEYQFDFIIDSYNEIEITINWELYYVDYDNNEEQNIVIKELILYECGDEIKLSEKSISDIPVKYWT